MDRNSCTDRHLLGPQGQIVGACGGTDFDKDLALVPKMNEVFALGRAEHYPCGVRSELGMPSDTLGLRRGPKTEQEGSAFLLDCVHDTLL